MCFSDNVITLLLCMWLCARGKEHCIQNKSDQICITLKINKGEM